MDIRVLLIAQNDHAREEDLSALEECPVQVFVSDSFQDLSDEICAHSYHGIFLDIQTKMRAIKINKNYVYGLVENFPICQLKINDQTGEINCFHHSHKSGGTMLDFIKDECRNFIPRMIRSDARKEMHLNVKLYKSKDDIQPELSVTINISRGGCFIFSTRERELGDDVWIQIMELQDNVLINGQIRHVARWGESMRIPGIGVEFRHISEAQVADIVKLKSVI
ncbi:MAG: PilZ domain-containing protein [Desulfatirhabdiaceae bacterium]